MSGQATKKVCDPREHPNALRFHCHTPLYFRFQFKCQTAPRNTQHDAATCPLIESGRHIAHKGPQKAYRPYKNWNYLKWNFWSVGTKKWMLANMDDKHTANKVMFILHQNSMRWMEIPSNTNPTNTTILHCIKAQGVLLHIQSAQHPHEAKILKYKIKKQEHIDD
jgi:hypothetical protein